jgi:hypothetical protein
LPQRPRLIKLIVAVRAKIAQGLGVDERIQDLLFLRGGLELKNLL